MEDVRVAKADRAVTAGTELGSSTALPKAAVSVELAGGRARRRVAAATDGQKSDSEATGYRVVYAGGSEAAATERVREEMGTPVEALTQNDRQEKRHALFSYP